MSQDPVQARLVEIVEVAAKARRLFPYGGFERLDSAQIQVLIAIASRDGISPGEVAVALAMEKSSVSEPIAGLETMGLIKISSIERDGRRRHLKITSDGSQLLSRFLAQSSRESRNAN